MFVTWRKKEQGSVLVLSVRSEKKKIDEVWKQREKLMFCVLGAKGGIKEKWEKLGTWDVYIESRREGKSGICVCY